MAHAERARKRGDSFEEQVVVAMQAMLVSPSFLFRIERDQSPRGGGGSVPDAYYLNDYELASRLSYFLWSSMPDDELTARCGQWHICGGRRFWMRRCSAC